jgi:hypothetical protein
VGGVRHPKHVEQFPDINKLCNVASCWIYTYIGIHLKMHGFINIKSPNNTSKWQMGFNSAFKGLNIVYIQSKHDISVLTVNSYMFLIEQSVIGMIQHLNTGKMQVRA